MSVGVGLPRMDFVDPAVDLTDAALEEVDAPWDEAALPDPPWEDAPMEAFLAAAAAAAVAAAVDVFPSRPDTSRRK